MKVAEYLAFIAVVEFGICRLNITRINFAIRELNFLENNLVVSHMSVSQ